MCRRGPGSRQACTASKRSSAGNGAGVYVLGGLFRSLLAAVSQANRSNYRRGGRLSTAHTIGSLYRYHTSLKTNGCHWCVIQPQGLTTCWSVFFITLIGYCSLSCYTGLMGPLGRGRVGEKRARAFVSLNYLRDCEVVSGTVIYLMAASQRGAT